MFIVTQQLLKCELFLLIKSLTALLPDLYFSSSMKKKIRAHGSGKE